MAITAAGWLGLRIAAAGESLGIVSQLVPQLKRDLLRDDANSAAVTMNELKLETSRAREASEDPLWALAIAFPWVGTNFSAAREVSQTAHDVVHLGVAPMVDMLQVVDWKNLIPAEGGSDLTSLENAQPAIIGAAQAVRDSSDRLNAISADALMPQIAVPLIDAREQLDSLRRGLDAGADAATVAPGMLGNAEPREYLLMIQNNSEIRATGGIPGALAVLRVEGGQPTLTNQSNASEIGVFTPALDLDPEQTQIYTSRLGKFMQDVNLTPDFPTAARTAQDMWEERTGDSLDGVISLDPVALSYILRSTGPVNVTNTSISALRGSGLPAELTSENVVQTLLSDVYSQIQDPALQDAYFAGAAKKVFEALSDGTEDAGGLIDGLTRASSEGRLRIWSERPEEQVVIAKYQIAGSVVGSSVAPAEFGVYFNDGTGAKMDYYVKRTVQLVKECPEDGYEQTTLSITSTNTAPGDAASSLPVYVTGNGLFGVPAGSVQTNVVAYGPVQANMETAKMDGERTDFAAHLHRGRPVGVLAVQLSPGESKTVEFTFGKIVQHTEPNLVVTPTVQDVKDVILPIESASCG